MKRYRIVFDSFDTDTDVTPCRRVWEGEAPDTAAAVSCVLGLDSRPVRVDRIWSIAQVTRSGPDVDKLRFARLLAAAADTGALDITAWSGGNQQRDELLAALGLSQRQIERIIERARRYIVASTTKDDAK